MQIINFMAQWSGMNAYDAIQAMTSGSIFSRSQSMGAGKQLRGRGPDSAGCAPAIVAGNPFDSGSGRAISLQQFFLSLRRFTLQGPMKIPVSQRTVRSNPGPA